MRLLCMKILGVKTPLLAAVAALAAALLLATPAHAADPVLGSPHYARDGSGFGTAQPTEIYNGGDPAGDASRLTWKHWGAATTTARGVIPIFRPHGGYYARPGRLVLRASQLGTCPDGTYGYTYLEFRVAHRPGGPVGKHWHPWASDGDICRDDG